MNLLELLDDTHPDFTVYLALADMAEERGEDLPATIWRMFYRLKTFPHKALHNHGTRARKGKYWWWWAFIDSMANSLDKAWAKSASEVPYTCLNQKQYEEFYRNKPEPCDFDKPSEAVESLFQFILANPALFEEELNHDRERLAWAIR